jgi:tetratricopeptide (TPR) repeat protein
MTDFRYKAFVSYSWSDAEWGKWLLHAIETYRTPKAMIGKAGANGPVPERLHPLFKDREEEAAGASIGAAVEAALATSEFLIVICSPRSAQSQWVNREVAWFKTHRDPSKILALIVDGEPGGGELECFPKALTHQVLPDLTVSDIPVDAPLAADARISGDGKRKARLKLAAAMLGVGLGELANRDEARRTLRTRIVVGSSLALATVMSGLAWFAVQARNEAQVQRGQAEGLVEYMISDLRVKLQPKVQIEVLGSIADRAQAFYAVQSKYPMDEEALARRARVLKLLAEIEDHRGNSGKSIALLEQSVASSRKLLERDPDNPDRILDQAFSLQELGNVLFQRGAMAGAEVKMQEAVGLTTHLVEDVGQKDEWLAEHGSALTNLGIVQLQQNRAEPAHDNLGKAITIKRRAIRLTDRAHTGWIDFALTLSWAAQNAERRGDIAAVKGLRAEEQDIYRRMLTDDPEDQVAISALTGSRFKQAETMLLQNETDSALRIAREADQQASASYQADPADPVMLEDFANAAAILAKAELQSGNLNQAAIAADRALALAERLAAYDRSVPRWNGVMVGQARLLAYATRARRASGPACRMALAPIESESTRLDALYSADRNNLKLGLVAARGQMMRADLRALSGDLTTAEAGWRKAASTLTSAYGTGGPIRDPAGQRLMEQIQQRQGMPRATSLVGTIAGICR